MKNGGKAKMERGMSSDTVREMPATLAALTGSNGSANGASPISKSLSEFLNVLPLL
jgi:hypothetical protein